MSVDPYIKPCCLEELALDTWPAHKDCYTRFCPRCGCGVFKRGSDLFLSYTPKFGTDIERSQYNRSDS